MLPILYTFAISHFSEKARWALDANALAFEERVLLPGAHVPVIRQRAKRTTVPLLEHDGEVVHGSSAILDWLERNGATKLAVPEGQRDRARSLEELVDNAFGHGTQTIFYDTLLNHRTVVVDLWSQRGPWWGRAFLTAVWPLLSRGVRRAYAPSREKVDAAKDGFHRAFDQTDAMLKEGNGRYLLGGDTPTRLDVTVAALLAPTCQPAEHTVSWPSIRPPVLDAFVRELQGRPTWDFVLRMYREQRR
jgi:glutathione S-transferase